MKLTIKGIEKLSDLQVAPPAGEKSAQPVAGFLFDLVVAILSGWLLVGIYLDGWALHHIPWEPGALFRPWTRVLLAFLVLTAFLAIVLVKNRVQGYPWRRAMPVGYGLSLLGALLFAIGGVGDLVQHEVFGVKGAVNALPSPIHLTLALGATLVVSGPLRAAWQRPKLMQGRFSHLPVILSLTFTLSVLTFFTQFAHPLVDPWAGVSHRLSPIWVSQAMGVVSVVLQTGILMGLVLLAMRRWALPPGALMLVVVLTFNAVLMSLLNDTFLLIPAAALAGLLADLLHGLLKPSAVRPRAFRLFAFAVPIAFYLLYFFTLMRTEGLWWPIQLWTGVVLLAGIVGWSLSYLLIPPQMPAERGEGTR